MGTFSLLTIFTNSLYFIEKIVYLMFVYKYGTFELLWKVINANNYFPFSAPLINNPAVKFIGITIYGLQVTIIIRQQL